MDPKLTILFLLIGSIIALSHLDESALNRTRRLFAVRKWRGLVPGRRRL
ncbi:MAG: hypothetical protein K9G60_16465 [Pseudolabrys sp.]|nr:hypothetical protein [Pseudolabrys sp.]